MKDKIKKILTSIGVAAALVVGGSVVAAPAAQAYTTYKEARYAGNNYYAVWVYVDYDWWEETFQGKRDYWFFSHYVYCSPTNRICVY